MSWGVDKVECVELAITSLILHLNGVALDGDTLLALEIHIVEHLSLHLALVQSVSLFEESVSKGTLAVIDVCNDTEIANILHLVSKLQYIIRAQR